MPSSGSNVFGSFEMMRRSPPLRLWLVIAGVSLLAACSGTQRPAQIPLSGINGNNGGADETIYYDKTGHPHFHV